jgi:hypothetical protein
MKVLVAAADQITPALAIKLNKIANKSSIQALFLITNEQTQSVDFDVPFYCNIKVQGKNTNWLQQGVAEVQGLTVASTNTFIDLSCKRRSETCSFTTDKLLAR